VPGVRGLLVEGCGEEVPIEKQKRVPLGRILLKGD
jgi:hypothetical protein